MRVLFDWHYQHELTEVVEVVFFTSISGKTHNVAIIVGLCFGAVTCVLVISMGYAIYKRNRNKAGEVKI